MNTDLKTIANNVFYDIEAKSYPNGGSPYSDSHRIAFVLGFMYGYRFLNDNGEKHEDNLLRSL